MPPPSTLLPPHTTLNLPLQPPAQWQPKPSRRHRTACKRPSTGSASKCITGPSCAACSNPLPVSGSKGWRCARSNYQIQDSPTWHLSVLTIRRKQKIDVLMAQLEAQQREHIEKELRLENGCVGTALSRGRNTLTASRPFREAILAYSTAWTSRIVSKIQRRLPRELRDMIYDAYWNDLGIAALSVIGMIHTAVPHPQDRKSVV